MTERPIDLRLWRQFAAVAQELHFGRAARSLHMTQPPLTQGIAQLEAMLGVRLFDRTKRSVRLSAGGTALLPQVRDLLARAQALPAIARAAAGGEAGRLRLAFVSTIGYTVLPQWVRAFRALCPQVRLDLLEATADVQAEAFERGDIDAGFVLHAPGFAPPDLVALRVACEPLVLALPAQHALALQRIEPSLEEAVRAPLVIFPRHIAPSLHDAVFGLYHLAGVLPEVAQEANQMQTIVNLVSAGLGAAWVPDSVRQFQRPGVVYRGLRRRTAAGVCAGLADPAQTHCETSLVWRPANANPALARFVAYVRSELEAGLQAPSSGLA